MGVAAASTGAGAAAYWGALVGNSLPDIDVPVGYALRKGWSFHRKYTHTAPGILVLSALATGVLSLIFPDSNPVVTLGWTLAGCLTHLFLDCLNVWGARPFWPVSHRRVGWGLLFILDPYLLLFHGLAAAGEANGLAGSVQLAWLLTGVYLALRAALRLRVMRLVRERLQAAAPGARFAVMPVLGGINRWAYVIETSAGRHRGHARAIPGHVEPAQVEGPAQ